MDDDTYTANNISTMWYERDCMYFIVNSEGIYVVEPMYTDCQMQILETHDGDAENFGLILISLGSWSYTMISVLILI